MSNAKSPYIHADSNGVKVLPMTGTDPRCPDGRPQRDMLGHVYEIHAERHSATFRLGELKFQQGPVKDYGVNGITLEALLAIGIHRLDILNNQFPCTENETALQGMKEALAALEARTAARQAKGVEGTNVAH